MWRPASVGYFESRRYTKLGYYLSTLADQMVTDEANRVAVATKFNNVFSGLYDLWRGVGKLMTTTSKEFLVLSPPDEEEVVFPTLKRVVKRPRFVTTRGVV